MSAFMLSRVHIATLAVAIAKAGRCYFSSDPVAIAHDLWAQNLASLQARYGDDVPETNDPEPKWALGWMQSLRTYSDVVLLKLCACYDYQACETQDYDDTDAAKSVDFLRYRIIDRLPGYGEAPWELPDKEVTP